MYSSRIADQCTVGVGTSLGNSSAFCFGDYGGGMILVPSTEGTPTLEFYTSDTASGTFLKVYPYNSASALSVTVAASIAKEIPPQLFSAHYVKIVASAISSGTSIPYTILLKA